MLGTMLLSTLLFNLVAFAIVVNPRLGSSQSNANFIPHSTPPIVHPKLTVPTELQSSINGLSETEPQYPTILEIL